MRGETLVRGAAAVLCGFWVAVFGWDAPAAAALAAPLTVLGVALLPRRYRVGSAVVLVANLAALLAGAPWGRIDMVLPLAFVAFAVGRAERERWLGPIIVVTAALPCAARDGFSASKLVLAVAVCAVPWVFGLIARERARRAHRAVAAASRLALEDPHEVGERIAAEDRERFTGIALACLRAAILDMQGAARAALVDLDRARVAEVHRSGVAAVGELRRLLDLLRDRREAPRAGEEAALRYALRDRGLAAWAPVAVCAVLMFIVLAWGPETERLPVLMLLYAGVLLAVGISRLAPLAGCATAALVSAGAAAVPPGPSDLLLPVGAGYAFLVWSMTRRATARHWFGIGLLLVAGVLLSLDYGPHGSGFVLLIVVVAGLAGIAWREQDAILRSAELEADRLRALLLRATEGALRTKRLEFARELHDVASHSVGAMLMQAGAAQALAERSPEEARGALRNVLSAGDRALEDTEGLLQALATNAGQRVGACWNETELRSRLVWLVDHSRAAGTEIGLDARGLPASPRCAEALFHAVREGIRNAERHASGARIEVTVERAGGDYIATVRNDGGPALIGAARGAFVHGGAGGAARRAASPGTGYGLAGIRERLRACDGELRAGPDGDTGFVLEARVPRQERGGLL